MAKKTSRIDNKSLIIGILLALVAVGGYSFISTKMKKPSEINVVTQENTKDRTNTLGQWDFDKKTDYSEGGWRVFTLRGGRAFETLALLQDGKLTRSAKNIPSTEYLWNKNFNYVPAGNAADYLESYVVEVVMLPKFASFTNSQISNGGGSSTEGDLMPAKLSPKLALELVEQNNFYAKTIVRKELAIEVPTTNTALTNFKFMIPASEVTKAIKGLKIQLNVEGLKYFRGYEIESITVSTVRKPSTNTTPGNSDTSDTGVTEENVSITGKVREMNANGIKSCWLDLDANRGSYRLDVSSIPAPSPYNPRTGKVSSASGCYQINSYVGKNVAIEGVLYTRNTGDVRLHSTKYIKVVSISAI